jgi:hypothetical protein
MSTSPEFQLKRRRAFVPNSAFAMSVTFDDAMMHVALTDGRILSVPLAWFPILRGDA